MSKIIFNYGTMNASKSAQLLMTAHNYEEKGETPILVKPSIDDRGEYLNQINSRIGLWAEADLVDYGNIRKESIEDAWEFNEKPSSILVDEAQFISEKTILNITSFAREHNLNVFAYGLLKDFKNQLFDSSKIWLQESDNFTEIKTTCKFCQRKATINARVIDNKIVTEGPTVVIGAEESYVSVCRYDYEKYQNEEIKGERNGNL